MRTEAVPQSTEDAVKEKATVVDYLTIARFDHATKHVLIIPGVVLAYILRHIQVHPVHVHIILGLVAAVCIASANYTINEWLDRDFDKFHPTKSRRTSVHKELHWYIVLLEWLAFLVTGLSCAYMASRTMFFVACVFALQGVVYNVPPLRLKDKPFLDVISESVNNPLRLMMGWAMIDSTTLPPGSIILSYYLGGAFLMAAKRLSEFREIVASHGQEHLACYRRSFGGYTETSLTVSTFLYALLSFFTLAVFLLKYRIEYILLTPIIAVLFCQYLALSMQPGSSAQKPEKLFRERGLMIVLGVLGAAFVFATLVDIPVVDSLTRQHYITIK